MRPVGSRPPPAPVSASPQPPRPPRPPGCPRAHWFRDRGGASRSRPPGPAAGSGGAVRAGAHLPGGRGTAGPAWRPSVPRGRWPLPWRARAWPVSMATSGRRGGECAAPSAGGSPGQRGLGPEGRPLDTQTNAPTADPPATPGSGAQAPPGRTLPPPCRAPASLCCLVSIATAARRDPSWIPGGLGHPAQARSLPLPAPHSRWCRRLSGRRAGRPPLPKTARETLLEGGGGDRQPGDARDCAGRWRRAPGALPSRGR